MTLRYNLTFLICSILISTQFLFPRTHLHPLEVKDATVGSFVFGERLPTISSISPATGTAGQTVNVVCTGTNFIQGLTTLNFGEGVIIRSVSVQSPTKLSAEITITESAQLGILSVSITNNVAGGGTTRRSRAFMIVSPPPELAKVSPNIVERGQTLTLQLSGKHLITDGMEAEFGPGIRIGSLAGAGPTQVTVEISVALDAPIGSRSITVSNEADREKKSVLESALAVVNPAPRITTISPVLLTKGQTTEIIVAGMNFLRGESSVNLGSGIRIKSLDVLNSSQIAVAAEVAEDAQVGPREVTVKNDAPGGGTANLADQLLVGNPSPTLESILPTEAKRGQTLDIVLKGTNFLPGVSDLDLGNSIVVNSVGFSGSEKLVASVTIAAAASRGARDVSVSNQAPGGGLATLGKSFLVLNPSPSLSSISPSKAARGSDATIVLSGGNFYSEVTSVSFGPDVTVQSLTLGNSSEISAVISVSAAAIAGPRSVIVTNAPPGGGKVMLTSALMVTAPSQGAEESALGSLPDDYVLQEAYPNPFNPSTTIRFGLPEESQVKLEIHNLIGKVVAELLDGTKPKGYYEIPWTPVNLPSGVYIVRLHAATADGKSSFVSSRKVVLLK